MLALEADGSAMYTLQALWTQARLGLDVTTVIFNNRSYAILNLELSRVGAEERRAPRRSTCSTSAGPTSTSWRSPRHGRARDAGPPPPRSSPTSSSARSPTAGPALVEAMLPAGL